MLKNYFITALRNLKRNKAYTILNVLGLALGVGCALVLFKVVTYELSYDSFQSNGNRIARLVNHTFYTGNENQGTQVPTPVGKALRNDFPDIQALSMTYMTPASFQINVTDNLGTVQRYEESNGMAFAESDIFKIVDIDLLAGNEEGILDEPKTIVLSRELVSKYFDVTEGFGEVLGKTININNVHDLKITGVFEDLPKNTSFPFKSLIHFYSLEGVNPYFQPESWQTMNGGVHCYFLLSQNGSASDLERMMPDFIDKYNKQDKDDYYYTFKVQQLDEFHYNTDYQVYGGQPIAFNTISILGLIAAFLVVIACVNFINLATAQAVNRSKEIGIRKVLGSVKHQLVAQFLGETMIISILASLISLGIAELIFMNLRDILGYELHLDLLSNPSTLLFLIGLTLSVGFLSGSYPAFLLSKMNPILALRTKLTGRQVSGGLGFRRSLVIFQFIIAQLFMIGTIVVTSQMDYLLNKDLGFDYQAVVNSYLPDSDEQDFAVFKSEILKIPQVAEVSFALGAPTANINNTGYLTYLPSGAENRYNVNIKDIDETYLELFDIPLVAGRDFMDDENEQNIIVNEKLVNTIGIDNVQDALGEVVDYYREGTIIGVVKDFHYYSLHWDIYPLILRYRPSNFREVSVKLKTDANYRETLNDLNDAWQKVYPEDLSKFALLDDQKHLLYEAEKKTSDLLNIFSIAAILISCLGLYGLISFLANQKTKEIGIRKVLGASVLNVLKIFSKELIYLLIIASVIAIPAAYMLMDSWLETFSYSIEIGPGLLLMATGLILLIALFTMGFRSVKSAMANPIDALKDE
ncbi:MAG: FtsX-like permease family protein [Cyclobacteriaceae bacterium]